MRLAVWLPLLCASVTMAADQQRPTDDPAELRNWLQNMVWHHQYSMEEMQQVTGLDAATLQARLQEFNISQSTRPARPEDRLLVLPYPGGRHPRIGFLDGAVDPQRETKLSVFCPWDDHSYAVLDVPEAIWSNLGLTYLAHTHVPTVWTRQNVQLPQQEWQQLDNGSYVMERRLPNGIVFGTKAIPVARTSAAPAHVRLKMWLTNGTDTPLTDLRVQNCVMLKAAEGFRQQTNDNKIFEDGYAVARSDDGSRHIITAWDPLHRNWGNVACPCLHSDPKFPDCPPGETTWLRGWFSFYQGDDLQAEIQRIENTGWQNHPLHHVTGNVTGKIRDADSGKLLPCRLYVQNMDSSEWHFASSTAVDGSAVRYEKQRPATRSFENHTTLSPDPFQLQLPAGRYRVVAERGKEYLTAETQIQVTDQHSAQNPATVELSLQRFSNLAELGWYSGDTHVHRSLEDLPNVILAEDLNVALPLNYWVRDSREIPTASGPELPAELQHVDDSHVIYPINTEYEIFTVDGQRHTLGAVFILNHQTPLTLPAPPVRPLAEAARRQQALLDLDKHSWNWSLMIVPVMNVDLFELTNNHHWRTQFGFSRWTVENAPPNWPEIQRTGDEFTELGWTEFGLQTYYALLNCGFRMRVSGGTASGVHPVPLGYGRVYVHTGDEFSYDRWISGLNAGHSFATNGPLLDVRFNQKLPGTTFNMAHPRNQVRVTGTIRSATPLKSVELVSNGQIVKSLDISAQQSGDRGTEFTLDETVPLQGSGWLALRCFQDLPDQKVRFAHTNPVFVDVTGHPLRPRRRDVQYFVQRMDDELQRNADVLSPEALAEFATAREIYAQLLQTATD